MSVNNPIKAKTAMIGKDQRQARIFIFSLLSILVVHTFYMNIMGFNTLNHDGCIVYQHIPRWLFLLYENLLELFIVVVLGIFAGVLIEKYFLKIKRFYPRNQLLAFLYGAILPVCSCGVVPLIESMQRKTSLKVVITFIIATPLLNPYIITVSYAVLGLEFTLLRIIFAFFTAIITGYIVDFAARKLAWGNIGEYRACTTTCDPILDRDPFVKTLRMTQKVLPYILLAGILSYILALINPKQYLESLSFSQEPWTSLIMILVGIPIYVCNGSDVLFLKPLLEYTDLSMGAAVAFSLSSSAVCLSSIIMLTKYLGTKLTIILLASIFFLMLLFSTLINLLF